MNRKFLRQMICLLLALCLFGTGIPFSLAAEEPSTETKAAISVPAISAPFTTHPVVYLVEDAYQIAFATNATGLAWVEIGGAKYEDASAGLRNWNNVYHKVTVPQEVLDAAGSYTICFQALSDRPAYYPTPGDTNSRTYPFTPAPADREPVLLCMSDQHGNVDRATGVAGAAAFDVLVMGGDYASELSADSDLKVLLDMAGGATQGTKPVIYSRGNHEVRGPLSHKLDQVSGYSKTTGAYYTFQIPGIFGIVLDAGEDKVDSSEPYGGTVDFENYRKEQTEWLKSVVRSREWENSPVRIAICHIPFSTHHYNVSVSVYNEWVELLDQMGVSVLLSGHTHYGAVYGPDHEKQKFDPNFTTIVVSHKDSDNAEYNGSFLTVKEDIIDVKMYEPDHTLHWKTTVPLVAKAESVTTRNADSTASVNAEREQVIATESSVRSQTRGVAAVSSPFTSHPAVFAVEDNYQIIFSTEKTGMAWVEIGGVQYKDTTTGLMNWASKYHRITVPSVALDTAKSYTICFQGMSNRKAYYPVHDDTVSRSYTFKPIANSSEPTFLCMNNMRYLTTQAKAVAEYKSFDALYIGGDYDAEAKTEANVASLLTLCGDITGGGLPIIYTRGNRENRGPYSYLLDDVTPYNPGTGSYYVAKMQDIYAIVLDSGEDKVDSNTAYGNTNAYEAYRAEQAQWLEELYESGEWKNYPTRVAFCHIPFTTVNVAEFKETYTKWTEMLNKMGISLLISGHNYTHKLYPASHTNHKTSPDFPLLVVSDVDDTNKTYSGAYVKFTDSTITIENVSNSKTLLATTTTPNVTATEYWENADDYILFDFNNDPVARQRYDDPVYGGLNFDLKSNWESELDVSATTISYGALSYSATMTTENGYGCYTRVVGSTKGNWDYTPLHYVPGENDYCQVRFKLEGAVSTRTDGKGTLRMDLDCPNNIGTESATKYYTRFTYDFNVSEVTDKGYITATIPLNTAAYRNMDWIRLVHPQFVNIAYDANATTTFYIDYIYIGDYANLPQHDDRLFFDFTNTEEDRQRYDSFTYNYTNYDDPSSWRAYNGSPIVSVVGDDLQLQVAVGNNDTKFSAYSKAVDSGSVLHYIPQAGDHIEVRLKIENAVATTENGVATLRLDIDRSNLVNGARYTGIPMTFSVADHVDGDYFTLTAEITNADYFASDWINLVHPVFLNMQSASGKTAKFSIDYIYLGPRSGLPSLQHTVSFCSEDGTLLETVTVFEGETATYSGAEPQKAYDGNVHYSFSGWKNAQGQFVELSNVTGDLLLYAGFTSEEHSYQYENNGENHSASCACGYEKQEEHVWDEGTLVQEASCTENGSIVFRCSCSASYTVAVEATGHREVVDEGVEATCTASGLTEGKHCEICGEVLIAQEVIPAGDHANTTTTTTEATCTEAGSVTVTCNDCGAVVSTEVVAATGHSYVTVKIDPTCTERGYDFHFCPCGASYTTNDVAALGHSYDDGEITAAPTCTQDGSRKYTCSACDDSYSEAIPATGHINTSTNTTDATCTEDGSVVVTCACGETVSTEIVAALGHSYAYSNNGENHNVTCANCDYAASEDHNYVDGSCICGAVESTEPVLDSTLSFGAQLYLENDLTMAFRVKGSKLANYDVSTAYLVVEREIYESGATEAFVDTVTISEYTVSADGRYVFSYPGIAAAQMNDAIRATLYIKDASGKEYVSPVLHTSVATYLDGLLSNSTSDTKLMTLILDMVNYGAAAQVYFDRHADAPVNEAFQSFKTYASYASADFTTSLEDLSGTTANEGATGKLNQGLDLGTRIGIQYKVTVPKGINAEDATLVITDKNGNELETIEVASGTVDSKGRYIVNFYGSTSKDMRRVVYATAYANGAAITGTYAYSISTYAWGIQENASAMDANLVNVTRMMMLYGDSASAYFG